jgi:hypothetical protein
LIAKLGKFFLLSSLVCHTSCYETHWILNGCKLILLTSVSEILNMS